MSTTTYSTGTVSVGAGSTSVTGVGTSWLTSGIRAGDRLVLAGLTARIASVNSNTSITLARGWPGGAQSAADYDIWLEDDGVRSLVATNSLLQALGAGTLTSLGALEGAANLMPYWTGAGVMNTTALTAAARTLLDDADVAAMRATLELVKTTSSTDATAGRLLKVGDFGLGGTVPLVGDISVTNNTIAPGFYRYSTVEGSTGGPTGVLEGHLWHSRRTSGGGETQLLIAESVSSGSASVVWLRVRGSGAWLPWRMSYGQGNTVGTVSQSGGVPTGAVIERGSNANGEYVRFADGTQICTQALTPTLAISTTSASLGFRSEPATSWTFPAAFSAVPKCGVNANSGATSLGAIGTTSLSFFFGSASSQVSAARIAHLTAIGRWF